MLCRSRFREFKLLHMKYIQSNVRVEKHCAFLESPDGNIKDIRSFVPTNYRGIIYWIQIFGKTCVNTFYEFCIGWIIRNQKP